MAARAYTALDMPAGTLYVVATPIGNLDDITLRALEILRAVAVIACEDTRRTRVLLGRHGIDGTLVPFHKFNEREAARALVRRLLAGEDVALVSDGGTPAISDPGYRLVREALDAGVEVTPLPGACAFVAAVSASGLPSESVTFRGFLPHRAGERRRAIEALRCELSTQVFYESPHRIEACLRDLAEILGPRSAAVAREITKRFETWHRGPLDEVARQVAAGPVKGEFCIVVAGLEKKAARRASLRSAGAGSSITGAPSDDDGEARSETQAAGAGAGNPGPGQKAGGESHGTGSTAGGHGPGEGDERPASSSERAGDPARLREAYEGALAAGFDRREALRRAALHCGLGRKEAYKLLHAD